MEVCEHHTLMCLQHGLLVAVLLVERNGWSTGMFMKLRCSPLVFCYSENREATFRKVLCLITVGLVWAL